MSLYHRLIRMVAFILCCRCIKVRVVQFFNCPFWSYSFSSALAFKRALNELVWRASLVVEGTLGLSLSELFCPWLLIGGVSRVVRGQGG